MGSHQREKKSGGGGGGGGDFCGRDSQRNEHRRILIEIKMLSGQERGNARSRRAWALLLPQGEIDGAPCRRASVKRVGRVEQGRYSKKSA